MSSKTAVSFPFPPIKNMSFCCSTTSPTFGTVSVLDFGHSNSYIILSLCSFNLHIHVIYYASSHMLIFYLYIFFGELSIKFFGSFFFFFYLFRAAYQHMEVPRLDVVSELHLRPIPQLAPTPDP